jgi:hypothetical protein
MTTPKHIANASRKIEEYLDALPGWSNKICSQLRKIILKSDPRIIEDWKWGPNYYLEGMVCGFAGFQKHVNLVFFRGALLQDKRKLLQANAGSLNNRHFRFTDVKEINEDLLLEYIIEAIDNNKKGYKPKKVADKTLVISPDIKKEFKSAGILTYFESLAYSHRKEYLGWIENAKKKETRVKRISGAIYMLGRKEMMQDKYKK